MLVVPNHVPVLAGERRVFVDSLADVRAADLGSYLLPHPVVVPPDSGAAYPTQTRLVPPTNQGASP